MIGYKVTQEITLFGDYNIIRVGDKVFKVSIVKEYLLQYHEALCSKYKQGSRTRYGKDGRLHIYYAWDSIFVEAHQKKIFWSIWKAHNSSNRI